MRVMGIDPGTVKMGVGVVDEIDNTLSTVFYTTVELSSKIHIHKRLGKIYSSILDFIIQYQPDVVALEDVYYGLSFKVAIRIGEARCAVILAATAEKVDVVEYLPTRVKAAVCGFGRGSKGQIQYMVKNILSLPEEPQSDAADALALAICHVQKSNTKKRLKHV